MASDVKRPLVIAKHILKDDLANSIMPDATYLALGCPLLFQPWQCFQSRYFKF